MVTETMQIHTGPQGLRRVLGLGSLLAVAVGLVVSQGVMVLMLQGVGLAGPGFILPLTLGYLLALCYACSFAELALQIPRAGGVSSYTEVALGQFPAILASFSGYVVVAMFAVSAELLLLDMVIAQAYPGLLPPFVAGAVVLLLFTVLNLLGIDIFARMQVALAAVMVIALLLLGMGAISQGDLDQLAASSRAAGDWNPLGAGVLTLTAMAIWGFVGAEFVCPLVEECRQPQRDVPRAMLLGLTIIFVVIALYGFGALLILPRQQLGSHALPHYLYAITVSGEAGRLLLVLAVVTATCSTLNTTLAAIPRMLYGMAQHGQAFPQFQRLSRYRTPWLAILFVAGIIGVPMLLLGQDADAIGLLLMAAALAWLLAYIIVHLDVMALRRRYPQQARPFRTPFYPLPQLFGIAGMGYAIYYASPAPELSGQVFGYAGLVLGVVSLIAVVWIKWVMKKPLFKPEPLRS